MFGANTESVVFERDCDVVLIPLGDRVTITEGLSRGDRVVTSAQFLIDSESNIEQALERMEPQQ